MGVKSNFSALLSTVAISSSVFLVESPACSKGIVVEGGVVRIAIISVAAYLKNRQVWLVEMEWKLGKM